ncbi:MAG: hypothetical protein R3F54_02490 [Alphaproteobacteria bacterium]
MTKLVDLAISDACPSVILIFELETLDAPLPVKTLLIALGIAPTPASSILRSYSSPPERTIGATQLCHRAFRACAFDRPPIDGQHDRHRLCHMPRKQVAPMAAPPSSRKRSENPAQHRATLTR